MPNYYFILWPRQIVDPYVNGINVISPFTLVPELPFPLAKLSKITSLALSIRSNGSDLRRNEGKSEGGRRRRRSSTLPHRTRKSKPYPSRRRRYHLLLSPHKPEHQIWLSSPSSTRYHEFLILFSLSHTNLCWFLSFRAVFALILNVSVKFLQM